MSIVNAAPKGGACNLFLKKKFWLLKDFSNKHFLNKKLEIFSKFKHENKLLVKSAEKWWFRLQLYCCIILVFIDRYISFLGYKK